MRNRFFTTPRSIRNCIFLFWAHFRREAPETGLSACIFFAYGKKGYRFYPLREPKPQSGFGFAEFHAAVLSLSARQTENCWPGPI
jgi:hypothetical protein